jgi:hypothetical protein
MCQKTLVKPPDVDISLISVQQFTSFHMLMGGTERHGKAFLQLFITIIHNQVDTWPLDFIQNTDKADELYHQMELRTVL